MLQFYGSKDTSTQMPGQMLLPTLFCNKVEKNVSTITNMVYMISRVSKQINNIGLHFKRNLDFVILQLRQQILNLLLMQLQVHLELWFKLIIHMQLTLKPNFQDGQQRLLVLPQLLQQKQRLKNMRMLEQLEVSTGQTLMLLLQPMTFSLKLVIKLQTVI